MHSPHPAYPSALLLLTFSACPDTPALPDESGTTDASSTGTSTADIPTTSDDPTTPSTSDPTTSTTSSPTTDETTADPPPACATFQCGALLACCAADDACIDSECAPACASGVRCGDDFAVCCAAGEVCQADACVPVGRPCTSSADCGPDDYCDPGAGACLPAQASPECTLTDGGVDLALEWAFTDEEVIAIPLVLDVTGDGVPEVFVNTARAGADPEDFNNGELICLGGATGELLWRIPHDPEGGRFGAHGRATIAAGDVSGDGVPDIVYAGRRVDQETSRTTLHAVDGAGAPLWSARTADLSLARLYADNGAIALANLDDDPQAEIAVGGAILDHDGRVVWDPGNTASLRGSPHNKGNPAAYLYKGGLPTFADLTGDGHPELITGREAWSIDWQQDDPPVVTLTLLWQDLSGTGGDGWPSVADLDGNGTPEVVLVAWPDIKVLDGATGELWCGVDPTGQQCEDDDSLRTQPIEVFPQLGGPPTIADFDGDGRPEFGLTDGDRYRLYDLNRPGETIVKPPNVPPPAPGAIYQRWYTFVQDGSAGATGSSAFDHDGDGAAAVFYQDECHVFAFDGRTGDVLLAMPNSSGTIHEYPIVADVDGDGASELLVVANLNNAQPNAYCAQQSPGWAPRKGVYLYRPAAGAWATTGAQWTQHTYHVTNADAAGNPPLSEQDNWKIPGRNDFRSAPSEGGAVAPPPDAPDLAVSLAVGQAMCPDALVLQAHVINQGALGVPAGVVVQFHAGTDAQSPVIAAAVTAAPLVPGGSTVVEAAVPAPAQGQQASYFAVVDPGDAVGECFEANNGALAYAAECLD